MTCDVKDRHVLAAAIKGGAAMLVTNNLRDFPQASTSAYEVEIISADDFLLDLLDASPRLVISTLSRQAARYKREPKSLDGLLGALGRCGVRGFVDEAQRLIA